MLGASSARPPGPYGEIVRSRSRHMSSERQHPRASVTDPIIVVQRSRGTFGRSEEHTSELQSLAYLVCRLLLEKKKLGVNYRFIDHFSPRYVFTGMTVA